MNNAIKTYIAELNNQYSTNVAHELSYRGIFQNLLTSLLPKGYTVVNEPTRDNCGAPDYIILKDKTPVSYIETKKLFDNDLDGRKEHKEQFDRYKKSLDHIVFTDYLNFHLYEDGIFIDSVRLAEGRGDKIILNEDSVDKFTQLIDRLAKARPQRITSPKRLASMMAGKARLLAKVIEQALENDKDQSSELANQLKVCQEFLIHDLNVKTFADIYAQTIAYGLFSARLNDPTPEDFSRNEANELIPKSNPFLRRIFNDIAGYNVDNRIAWIIDDLVEVFRVTDMSKVMKGFGGTSGRTDPMMHFYEDFLGEYDPSSKKSRGVYYTPQPVVDFIVRAVDDILKRDFNLPMGLADNSMIEQTLKNEWYRGSKTKGDTKNIKKKIHRVQILDPATGTGTFLAAVIRQIHANMEGQWGVWNDYVEKHLIPRLNGFELMMASYTIAHLKLGMVLKETGFTQQSDQRLRVYLTNSLEDYNATTGTLFAAAISQESDEASRIKRDTPVMVMMGNPPYSVSSSNNSTYITHLLDSYKKDLNERNIQPLSDDYIKFIRLGQEYISKNGEGVLAFICNNSFLDGIIHRQMRKELMGTFNMIYILDLHGNSRKKEISPDGSKDENVFDIMSGVSINIFVKKPQKTKKCIVYHYDLFGNRESKYNFLLTNNLKSIQWSALNSLEPYFFFVPKDFSSKEEYDKYFKIDNLMPFYISGVQSGRDDIYVDSIKESLERKVQTLLSGNIPEEFKKVYKVVDSSSYPLLKRIAASRFSSDKIIPYYYRIFDKRLIYYDKDLIKRAFYNVLQYMQRDNVSLLLSKQQSTFGFQHVIVSDCVSDMNAVSMQTKEGNYVFPLYRYSKDGTIRKPNLDNEIWDKINAAVGEETLPEELFDYIYAVLHSPSYRTKYKEFLKIDFPKIPYPTNAKEYHRLSAIGSQLRKLHLMEAVPASKHAQFNTPGSNMVDKPEYKGGNVWVNKDQCFEDVPEIAWNFYIGGYQPAQKWLKDRKGCILSYDDIIHYRKIITILLETDRLMHEIDSNTLK